MKDTVNKFIGKHMMTLALVIGLVVLVLLVYVKNTSDGGQTDFIESARRAVESQGYTNVQYVEVALYACGDSHSGFAFDADNASGGRGRVVACSPDGDAGANWRGNWFVIAKGQ